MNFSKKNHELKNINKIDVSKTIAKILTSLMVFLITTTLQAQTTTTSSSKSSSTVSVHSDSDDNNSSYSYSDSSKQNNVSVSISNSEDSYSFRGKFPSEKHQEIKDVLTKEMSSKNHTNSNGKDIWESDSNGEEVYKVNLSKTKLSMHLDKDIASSSLAEKFQALGLTIRTVIVGEQNEARRDAERLQREADRLRRDAERMQREADRIQRDAQRQAADASRQYRDDARKIADEARRLADEASGLNLRASHKGAISSNVRQLLNESKTAYNETTKSAFNWVWPDAQKELLAAFKKSNLIKTENDVVLIKDQSGMHVNGKHLSENQETKYNNILARHKIPSSLYFTFYKTYSNIVLVNSNANIEDFIEDAVSNNILESSKKKVALKLNGNKAYINGNQVSTAVLSKLNKILLQNNIIASPGKIFEIMKTGNYKLGYSLGEKSHLGTWQFSD